MDYQHPRIAYDVVAVMTWTGDLSMTFIKMAFEKTTK